MGMNSETQPAASRHVWNVRADSRTYVLAASFARRGSGEELEDTFPNRPAALRNWKKFLGFLDSTLSITYTKLFWTFHVVAEAPQVPRLGPEPHGEVGDHDF